MGNVAVVKLSSSSLYLDILITFLQIRQRVEITKSKNKKNSNHLPTPQQLFGTYSPCFQEIVCTLDDGKHKLNAATDCMQKLLSKLTPDARGQLDAEIATLKSDWLNLNTNIDNIYGGLEERMAQWTKFNEVLEQLTRGLGETRQDLVMAAEPKVELMEKKVQLDKLKVSVLPPGVYKST